jgi:integrase
MARMNRLTALKIEKAKTPGMYCDGGGLYLQVTRGGDGVNKSWIFKYATPTSTPGKRRTREAGLGSLHTISLAEAREKARQARHQLIDGIDVIDAKRAAKAQRRIEAAKAMTFQQCADALVAAKRPGWRNAKHAAQWETTLREYAYPILGALPVQAVDTALVLKVLQQHVEAEHGPAGEFWQSRPETASRLRARIEAVLDWAKARGYRNGSENPGRWKGHLDHLLPARSKVRKVEHHPALPYTELPTFLIELRERDGIAARAMEFLILTAARAGEVLGARWSEFDLLDKTWTVPAERMKAHREHRVPLSDRALTILQEMQAHRTGDDAFVFPGGNPGKPLSTTALWEVLFVMGRKVTTHGFRSTFRDWAAERTRYPNHVVEQALAHTIGSAVERAYRRSDLFEERRKLMNAWATFCTTEPTAPGKIVPMQRRG